MSTTEPTEPATDTSPTEPTIPYTLRSKLPPNFGHYPPDAEILTHKGGCHCGKFGYEFKYPSLDVAKPTSCNCSWCTRTGALHCYGLRKFLELDPSKAPLSELSNFVNKKGVARIYFCPYDGCQLFFIIEVLGAVGVNARNFEGLKVEELQWNSVGPRATSS